MTDSQYIKIKWHGIWSAHYIKTILLICLVICSNVTFSANDKNLDTAAQQKIISLVYSFTTANKKLAVTNQIKDILNTMAATESNMHALFQCIGQLRTNPKRIPGGIERIIANVLLPYHSQWDALLKTNQNEVTDMLAGITTQDLTEDKSTSKDQINSIIAEYQERGKTFMSDYHESAVAHNIDSPYTTLKRSESIEEFNFLLPIMLDKQIKQFKDTGEPSAWLNVQNMLMPQTLSIKNMCDCDAKPYIKEESFSNAMRGYKKEKSDEAIVDRPKLYYTGKNHYWTNIKINSEIHEESLQNAIYQSALCKKIILDSSEIQKFITSIIIADEALRAKKNIHETSSKITIFFPLAEHGSFAQSIKDWIAQNPAELNNILQKHSKTKQTIGGVEKPPTSIHIFNLKEQKTQKQTVNVKIAAQMASLPNELHENPINNVVMVLDAGELETYGHNVMLEALINIFTKKYTNNGIIAYYGWNDFSIDKAEIFSDQGNIVLPPNFNDKQIDDTGWSKNVVFTSLFSKACKAKGWTLLETCLSYVRRIENEGMAISIPETLKRPVWTKGSYLQPAKITTDKGHNILNLFHCPNCSFPMAIYSNDLNCKELRCGRNAAYEQIGQHASYQQCMKVVKQPNSQGCGCAIKIFTERKAHSHKAVLSSH